MFINAADEETPRRLRQALQPETMGLQLIRTSGELLEIHDQHQTKAVGAVSYTHLDVSKRQGQR